MFRFWKLVSHNHDSVLNTSELRWAINASHNTVRKCVDLLLERGNRRLAFEFKASSSPHLSKGFSKTVEALEIEKTLVVCPIEEEGYPVKKSARGCGIAGCLNLLEEYAR